MMDRIVYAELELIRYPKEIKQIKELIKTKFDLIQRHAGNYFIVEKEIEK